MSINPKTYEAIKLMQDGILALARAERAGIRIDMEYIERKKKSLTKKVARLETEFKESDFFKDWQRSVKGKTVNINSNPQLSKYLFDVLKLTSSTQTAKGNNSTDEKALAQLNIPELNILLEISKLKKIRDTYLAGFEREQVNGFLHPSFNLHIARTYRSSMADPNMQNIPKRDTETMQICRKAIIPRDGNQFVEFDLSGAEVRIAVAYHKDKTMIKYVTDPTTDMHGDLAQQLFIVPDFDKKIPEHYVLRQAAKNGFIFPEFYGDYYKNCAVNLACNWGKLPESFWKAGQGISMPKGNLADHLISKGIRSLTGFTNHVKKIEADFWENRFSEYAQWKEDWYEQYQKKGYVDYLTGFRSSGVMSKNDVINYPVQGAAFHCLLWILIQLDKYIIKNELKSKIVNQIHDSILVDLFPPELDRLTKAINNIVSNRLPKHFSWINVPIEMDCDIYEVDGSWADKIK